MVVQHNIAALNAHRNLNINNAFTSSNLEKLSSGYRVNRSADDAAGLAISEKMRGQIRGLNMASMNVSHAEDLIQTAEGGLQEVHAILERMRELAVQAANGTYDNEVDRYNLDKELQALKSEIDRISMSTNYNGINLLDGTLGAATALQLPGGTLVTPVVPYDAGSLYSVFHQLYDYGFPVQFNGANTNSCGVSLTVSPDLQGQTANLIINHGVDDSGNDKAYVALQVGGATYMGVYDSAKGYVFSDENGNEVAVLTLSTPTPTPTTPAPFLAGSPHVSGIIAGIQLNDSGVTTDLWEDPLTQADLLALIDDTHPLYTSLFGDETTSTWFQIGANGTADQQAFLSVLNMSTASLGTLQATAFNATGTIADISVADQDAANDAIAIIDAAVNQVSSVRTDLGALQNRLEHTQNNLGVTAENLTAAESTIRDVDMAQEMMEYTKNNILVQAAQAMLAQAQTLPQSVLQLLQ